MPQLERKSNATVRFARSTCCLSTFDALPAGVDVLSVSSNRTTRSLYLSLWPARTTRDGFISNWKTGTEYTFSHYILEHL